MAFLNPTVTDFKNYFTRDFPYGTDPSVSILDSDIAKAFGQVNFAINSALFPNQESYTLGYLYLAAFWLVTDIRASSQGIAGQYDWGVTSKGVGSVSEGITIPQRILDNPSMLMYSKNQYGAKYLQLILPLLCGYVITGHGHTKP